MTATARHARQGAVTVAARQAMTMAGPCEPGDVLGAIGGDFVVVGHDLTEVAEDVLGRLLGGGGEMVTLVSGARRRGRRAGRDLRRLARGAPPDCRRRGVRRWPGALPAPGRRRVGARSVIDLDSPVETVLGEPKDKRAQRPQRADRRGARPADRRRPAAPLPAALPRDRRAHRARRASRRASCSRWSARSPTSRVNTYQTAAPAARPTASTSTLRTDGPVAADVVLRQEPARRRLAGRAGCGRAGAGSSSGKVDTFRGEWQLTNPQMVLFGATARRARTSPSSRWSRSARSTRSTRSPRASSRGTSSARSPSPAPWSTRCPTCCPTQVREQLRRARRAHGPRLDPRPRHLGPDHAAPSTATGSRRRWSPSSSSAGAAGRCARWGPRPRDGGDGGLLAAFDARLPFELTAGPAGDRRRRSSTTSPSRTR